MLRTNSSSLQPDRHLVLPSPSAGPPLGRSSADCAELSLIVSGSRDLPRGRRPQTEAVCRLLESQRKWGERWESTGRKATCRPVMQAERGCHRRGERDTWWARGNDFLQTWEESFWATADIRFEVAAIICVYVCRKVYEFHQTAEPEEDTPNGTGG